MDTTRRKWESGDMQEQSAKAARGARRLIRLGAVAAGLWLTVMTIWALTGAGGFWPFWVILPTALLLAAYAWVLWTDVEAARFQGRRMTRALAVQLGLSGILCFFFTAIWAFAGGGYFWPVWPLFGLAVLAGLHFAGVMLSGPDETALTERIEQLTTTRAGAVDAQEVELRRIERDLHDGAQARLVALGMNLGMAEQKLAADPEAARALLAEARQGATEALAELRDLARGIHPPVLADRGLEAAVRELAVRTPMQVTVDGGAGISRLPPAVESAAYFVAAEALANAGKHARATHVTIRLERERERGGLVVEIADDGEGGADPSGAGLVGLRRRVEALDGSLQVTSPRGGPTRVRAELPCKEGE
jgi:signal transduction histidine kinase